MNKKIIQRNKVTDKLWSMRKRMTSRAPWNIQNTWITFTENKQLACCYKNVFNEYTKNRKRIIKKMHFLTVFNLCRTILRRWNEFSEFIINRQKLNNIQYIENTMLMVKTERKLKNYYHVTWGKQEDQALNYKKMESL